jgi:hypothetical protein
MCPEKFFGLGLAAQVQLAGTGRQQPFPGQAAAERRSHQPGMSSYVCESLFCHLFFPANYSQSSVLIFPSGTPFPARLLLKFLIIVVYFLRFFIYRSSKFRVFASIQKIKLLLKLDWLLV